MNNDNPSTQPNENYVDIERVAQFLNVSKSWVYKECEAGRLPHCKMRRALRFRLSELEKWVSAQSPLRPASA
jgi:excisionase family DNA binding protein